MRRGVKRKNWTATYKPGRAPAFFRGTELVFDPPLKREENREESMKEETKYAMIEHSPTRRTPVRFCWTHGDNCPHVAGECPDMSRNKQEFSDEPIEVEVIPYVDGVTDGNCVVSVFGDSDVPPEFDYYI